MKLIQYVGIATAWAKIGRCAVASVNRPASMAVRNVSSGHVTTLATNKVENDVKTAADMRNRLIVRHFSRCCPLRLPRGGNRGSRNFFNDNEMEEIVTPPSYSNPVHANQESLKHFMQSAKGSDPEMPPEFPSDLINEKNQRKRDQRRGSYRPSVDPRETSVLLFPGQGSQFVGMGAEAVKIPKVQELYGVANDILGYDLLSLCLNGPKEKLDKTVHCQPAVFVASLAAVEKLKEENAMAIEQCIAAAGFSVGEFAALVFAGSLSFETALDIVQQRAEAMQLASEEMPSGMMTAFLGPDNKAKMACHTAKLYCTKELDMDPDFVDCVVANYLYPECKVFAGNIEALDFITKNSKEFGIRRTKRLPVSGAFHTKLMSSAKPVLKDALNKAEVKKPLISVHSNVNSFSYKSANDIRKLLTQQVCEPVKWEQTMHKIYERKQNLHFPSTFEVGPGRQLGAMLKMNNGKAYDSYRPVNV